MATENAIALVIRTYDWSESSRIAVLWTREFGKVRGLAKGGRRLRSSFEVALDLLTVCSIVLIRKSGGLDLLTEARVEERFNALRLDLPRLYAGYYVAELLGEGTQEHDPHPVLFDQAIATLRLLNEKSSDVVGAISRFELVWLQELGYRPVWTQCVNCGDSGVITTASRVQFSPSAGGVLCKNCERGIRDLHGLSPEVLHWFNRESGESQLPMPAMWRHEGRPLLNDYISYVLGKRLRMMNYLGVS